MLRIDKRVTQSAKGLVSRAVLWKLILALTCVSLILVKQGLASDEAPLSIGTKITRDYSHFYSKKRLTRMGIAFLTLGTIANTEIDVNIQNWYQDEMRGKKSDRYFETAKLFGEGKYLIPLSLLASSASYFDSNSRIGNWGQNTARAYAVGGPAVLLMQRVIGASRPEELSQGSKWKPLNDNNGVSGHAFIGAVPFLTLAKMNPENKLLQYSAYAASSLTAWSRVNSNSHYISQVILGWYMAYESVNSIFDTNKPASKISIIPIVSNDVYGLRISATW